MISTTPQTDKKTNNETSPEMLSVSYNRDWQYKIITHYNIFNREDPFLYSLTEGKKLLIITDDIVDKIYGKDIQNYILHWHDTFMVNVLKIPTGEKNKNYQLVESIIDCAEEAGLGRNDLLIAIGGGITNDIVGMAASLYKRSISYIKINTTLLGQVDAGIGIKVGINSKRCKNAIGTYYAPTVAINDPTLLNTLPKVELQCGLSEIIKMAILRDYKLFELVEKNHESILNVGIELLSSSPHSALHTIIQKAVSGMINELRPNMFEDNKERAVDFGHSFGPTIEIDSNYTIRHGEAVSIDMAISSALAKEMGILSVENCDRILNLLKRIGLPIYHPQYCTTSRMWDALEKISTRRDNMVNLVVPTTIGETIFLKEMKDIDKKSLESALAFLKETGLQS